MKYMIQFPHLGNNIFADVVLHHIEPYCGEKKELHHEGKN